MGEEAVLAIGSEAIKVMIMIGGPLLLAAMAIGIGVRGIQAITQITGR